MRVSTVPPDWPSSSPFRPPAVSAVAGIRFQLASLRIATTFQPQTRSLAPATSTAHLQPRSRQYYVTWNKWVASTNLQSRSALRCAVARPERAPPQLPALSTQWRQQSIAAAAGAPSRARRPSHCAASVAPADRAPSARWRRLRARLQLRSN